MKDGNELKIKIKIKKMGHNMMMDGRGGGGGLHDVRDLPWGISEIWETRV